ncbi:hypothetical protein A8W25_22770 [Streptomyces sp. ERV7]|nr:hypothetical protein A8W25_22770 [Streptomyces sp. ERV7]
MDFSKEPPTRHHWQAGVVNLALTFGTLLSSQGTDASFVPVSGPSGRFLRFRLYQTLSCPIPGLPGQVVLSFRLLGRSDVPDSSGFLGRLLIGPFEPSTPIRNRIRHAEIHPAREVVLSWVAASLRRTAVAEPFRPRDNSKNFTYFRNRRQLGAGRPRQALQLSSAASRSERELMQYRWSVGVG